MTERSHPCPKCKKPLHRIEGKMGPFWGCTGFPSCRTTLNDIAGKPSTEINEHYRCPICTRRMVRADKGRGDYWFCSGYSKGCKIILQDANGSPEATHRCPDCDNLLVKRQGKNGMFWGCSDFPRCKTTLSAKSF
ncbi:MAG: topoisomerase DNA-binding C4 zinc finger domain-containing protein [Gammaproteobacteria bacterium]|nr:topoisomerase DNA-binding C4 zinc finger domain-containing protein [Gammaproteobacteria bacterium]